MTGQTYTTINISLSITSGGNMGNAEEWARSLAKKNEEKELQSSEQARITAMSRDIVAEQMPIVWDDLLREFQSHCNAYNEQVKPQRTLTLFRTGQNDFMVRPDALEEIVRGHYDYQTKDISIVTVRGTERFMPRPVLSGTGHVELVSRSTGRQISPVSIAQNAIETGLNR